MTRWLLAAIHLLGLALGLGGVWARGSALRGTLDAAGFKRAFAADGWWGVSAILSLGTGLVRAFGGFEKGTGYYLANHLFLGKMALVTLILALELQPMVVLIRWRLQLARGEQPDTTVARHLARISTVQAALLVIMLVLATGMARGFGTPHQ